MTEIPNWILSIDPGGSYTGVVLARLQQGVLTPVDGLTFRRLEAERDTEHTGTPAYCRRLMMDAIYAMLDKHGIEGDVGLAVCVETMVPPKPMPRPGNDGRFVPMAVWRADFGAYAILGAVCVVFPDAILVAPNKHDLKKDYPSVLKGRRPKSWMATGSSERGHQRAAFSIMLAGLNLAGIKCKVAPDGAPPVGVDADDLAAAVAAIKARLKAETSSLAMLVDATFKACPKVTGEDLVDLMLAASQAIKPSKDPIGLRARLAARLDSFNVDSLI